MTNNDVEKAREWYDQGCFSAARTLYEAEIQNLQSKLNERSWVAVADGLPKIGVPVWMRFESGLIVIGEMGMVSDDEWLWGQAYGGARYVKGRWEVDDSDTDDDYRPTHWMPLPEPPK